MVSEVQEWSDKHPELTMAEKFFEMFPNAPRYTEALPKACPYKLGWGESSDCAGKNALPVGAGHIKRWKMKVCKHCGNDSGYYVLETVRRKLYYTADDEEDGSESEDAIYSGKVKRCQQCMKKWETIEVTE